MSTVVKKQQVSYVESSSDQSSVVTQDITQVNNLYQPFNVGRDDVYIDQINLPPGQRSFPGQGLNDTEATDSTQQGFLWADTPEASVFIRKKQWREEGWNLGVPQGMAADTNYQDNRDFDLQVREIAGRIITSKLEWMNDHEQFSKSAAAMRTFLVDANKHQLPQFIRGQYEVTDINGEALKSIMKKVLNLVYGEVAVKDMKDAQKADFVEKFFKDNDDIIHSAVLKNATANGGVLSLDDYNRQHQDLTLVIPKGTILFYDSMSNLLEQFTADTSGYVSPNGDLTAAARSLLYSLYAPTTMSDGAFTRYFQTPVKLGGGVGATGPEQQSKTVFNGVMEFANISNISVSRSLNGDGTANLTFENPGNIMMISRTDVDLGLSEFTGENPYDGMAGANPNDTPDKELPNVSNLVFYRGRYYTKTAKANLGYSYADLTAGGPQVAAAPEFSKNFKGVQSVTANKYTVTNDGETVQSIHEKTGYSIQEILDLNPWIQAKFDLQNSYDYKLQKRTEQEQAMGLPPKDMVEAYFNGKKVTLPASTMALLTKANEAYKADHQGRDIEVTDSYRTASEELQYSEKYPMSGPSYHERGLAIDVHNWYEAGPYLRAVGFKNPLLGTAGNSKTWDPYHFSLGFKGWVQDEKTGKVISASGSESTS